ncbi:hypothetical protein NN561_003798 [Cricetulus griseus]
MGRGSGAWPGPPPSPPPTQRVTLRAPVVSGVLPLPPLGGASQRPAGLLRGTGRALVVEAWSRSRRHRLWLRLCAREPGREGGARSRECSCGCVETLGAAEPALAAARPELTAETKATLVRSRRGRHCGPLPQPRQSGPARSGWAPGPRLLPGRPGTPGEEAGPPPRSRSRDSYRLLHRELAAAAVVSITNGCVIASFVDNTLEMWTFERS